MKKIRINGVLWNLMGSIANAGASAVLLLAVTRICGVEEAGVFSIAFVTAQMLMSVGNYGVRAYQVSDMCEKYSLKEYEAHRIITCIAMLFSIAIFIIIRGYSYSTAYVIFLMGIYKMIDAYADVYEGYLQQNNHLEKAGKSLFYRTIISILVFIIVLWIKKEVTAASIGAIIAAGALFILLAVRPAYIQLRGNRKISWINIRNIFVDCFPLFCSIILLSVIVNIPKYSIEEHLTYEEQTYYNIIYLPAQIIYLLSSIIFKPFLTMLTDIFHKKPSDFKKIILRFIGIILIIISIVLLGANFWGIPCLQLLYGVDLSPYKNAFLCILLGGGCNAIVGFLHYMLTIMRKQFAAMLSYVVGIISTLGIVGLLVSRYGIMGAALAYFEGMFLTMAIMFITLYSRKVTEEKGGTEKCQEP